MADFGGSRRGRRRDAAWAISILLLAFLLLFLPLRWTQPVRMAFRTTVVRPFIAMQSWVATRRAEREDLTVVRAQRDSLAAVAAAQALLAQENERLRSMLTLSERTGPRYRTARLLRLGVGPAESTFLIDLGSADGVVVGSPVFTADGLVGVVSEVTEHSSQALDWTHPEFRVSAVTADGQVYGVVEAMRGAFREEDLLVMTGAPFHSDVRPGRRVVTSGRGLLFPRGIPIGRVVGIENADTGWRKSYILEPAIRPEAVSHVLVGLESSGSNDLSALWQVAGETPPAAQRDPPRDSQPNH
jgi:rod shape-determining protein MreC